MGSQIHYDDDETLEIHHLSKTQCLETAYKETMRKVEVIIQDETERRLRVQILLLEHDNDDLQEQLAHGDDRIDELEQEGEDLKSQLEEARESVSYLETEMRTQVRELGNLRAELSAMNGVTTDSTKLLTEKLILSRELATLKPELDHLRSQFTYQQTVLSEKLALQRQVNTLEVELETEKRASKRAALKNENNETSLEFQQQLEVLQKDLIREKGGRDKAQRQVDQLQLELQEAEKRASKHVAEKFNNGDKELELQRHLDSIQKDLVREKREHEKSQKEAEKDFNSLEARKCVLESKLEQMRTKLRSTKEELKECQAELGQARAAMGKAGGTSKTGDVPAKNPRKRTALAMSTDDNIGTPDGVAGRGKRPMVRRGRMDQAMVGEKSMFSITPYLNRTANMAPDTPDQEESEIAETLENELELAASGDQCLIETISKAPLDDQISTPSATATVKVKRKIAEKIVPVKKNVLSGAKASTSNKKAPTKKIRTIGTLEKVAEEEVDENEGTIAAPELGAATTTTTGKPGALKSLKVQLEDTDETEPKKKRRKLLGGGKTLFDEDDGEATKRPVKAALGQSRLLGKGGLAGPKGGLKGGLSTASAFGAFSPLKKDRRGIGASFLA